MYSVLAKHAENMRWFHGGDVDAVRVVRCQLVKHTLHCSRGTFSHWTVHEAFLGENIHHEFMVGCVTLLCHLMSGYLTSDVVEALA